MKATNNYFSRVLVALVLCAGLMVTGCAKINDALEGHGNRLDNLEGVQIKNLKEQVSSINVSLKDLQTVDANLQKLIDDLESEAADLQTQLDANSAADSATKKALEDEIANIKALIAALQAKDVDLDQKIADLRTYVDNELKGTEDWANATFATLAQYTAVQTELSAIKALLEQSGIDIGADLSAIQKAIEDAIAASETSMKGWVNTTLAEGYYNIAAIDGKIAALNAAITEGDEALAADIAVLTSKLDQAKADLTTAYQSAIETAINDNNGVIRGEIADAITEAIEGVDAKLQTINTAIADLQAEIELLKQGIASINEQISGINTSLGLLETMDETLQGYIDALESKAEELEQKLEANSSSDAATKKALEDEIANIKALIAALQAKDVDFDQKIADLRTYVDNELKGTEDWANATFATLAQYTAVQTELSAIKALLEQNGGDIEADLSAIQQAIEDAIAASEISMKGWVNATLAEGYYNIAAIDGKIAALNAAITEGDEALAADIAELTSKLDQAKADLTTAYLAAIETAINDNNGVIRGEIADAITEAQNALQLQITSITSDITTIKEELNSIKNKLDELLSRIQSVVYMPEYSDGSTPVDFATKEVELSFKISPSSVVSSLESVWESALSIKYLTTELTKAAPVMHDLSIKSAEFDKTIGTISLVVDCTNLPDSFYKRTASASAALFISDGENNVSSEFIPLVLGENEITEWVDLSSSGTANSYIVSESGGYMFKTVKGNSVESVGIVDKPEVLWETFGTDVTPNVGDLVTNVTYKDGYIAFEASDKKGNAVIAAKDAEGNILWSWHIWLTDQPQGQVYYSNAGTMMDRNLGATSATPGDVGALGLLYQWGRKDPFLGSSSISSSTVAKSTLSWPSVVESTSSTGTIDYVTANPTTFVTYNSNNYDWYYTGSLSTDDTRWQSSKTIYDPCPLGWRVPDGGNSGVWLKAGFDDTTYDSSNKGISFSISSPSTTWYPASGNRHYRDGGLYDVGYYGYYWSVAPYGYDAYLLYFDYGSGVGPLYYCNRVCGSAVRCLQE